MKVGIKNVFKNFGNIESSRGWGQHFAWGGGRGAAVSTLPVATFRQSVITQFKKEKCNGSG
jgi:hypothetical protein